MSSNTVTTASVHTSEIILGRQPRNRINAMNRTTLPDLYPHSGAAQVRLVLAAGGAGSHVCTPEKEA